MGRPVVRLGDVNAKGAPVIKTKQKTVISGGSPIATTGDKVAPHGKKKHKVPFTGKGSSTVLVRGVPTNRVGDKDTCFHPRVSGNPTVLIGG